MKVKDFINIIEKYRKFGHIDIDEYSLEHGGCEIIDKHEIFHDSMTINLNMQETEEIRKIRNKMKKLNNKCAKLESEKAELIEMLERIYSQWDMGFSLDNDEILMEDVKNILEKQDDKFFNMFTKITRRLDDRIKEVAELKEQIEKLQKENNILKIEMLKSNAWLERLVREKAELTSQIHELVEALEEAIDKLHFVGHVEEYCEMLDKYSHLIEQAKEVK